MSPREQVKKAGNELVVRVARNGHWTFQTASGRVLLRFSGGEARRKGEPRTAMEMAAAVANHYVLDMARAFASKRRQTLEIGQK